MCKTLINIVENGFLHNFRDVRLNNLRSDYQASIVPLILAFTVHAKHRDQDRGIIKNIHDLSNHFMIKLADIK